MPLGQRALVPKSLSAIVKLGYEGCLQVWGVPDN